MQSNSSNLKFLAFGGVAGPLLFTGIMLVCAGLRPEYSHISQFISELGADGTPNANLMNRAGFISSALFIAAYSISLMVFMPKRLILRIAAVFILLFSVGMLVAGVFSCDVGCPREGTMENTIHDLVSGPAFFSAIVGIFLHSIGFRKLPVWQGMWIYSAASAVLALAFMVALIIAIESDGNKGMWQRLLLATIFLWLAITGLKLFRSS